MVGGLLGSSVVSCRVSGGQLFRGTRPHSHLSAPPEALRAGKAAHRQSLGSTAWGPRRPAGPRQLRLSSAFVLPVQGRLAQPGRVYLRGQLGRGCSCGQEAHGGRLQVLALCWGEGPRWTLQLSAPPFQMLGPYISVTQTGDSSRALPPQLGAPGSALPELHNQPHPSRAVCSSKACRPL